VKVKNSFGGGDVKFDNTRYYDITADGITFTRRASTFPHSVEAIDGQSFGGYVQRYQFWTSSQGLQDAANPLSVSTPPTSSITYTANFLKEFNVTFQNNFICVGNGGTIKVDGYTRNSSYTTQVLQNNSITGEALWQVINSIQYTFSQWADGVTTNPRTFTPNGHITYAANFTGKPTHVTITSSSGPPNDNVRIVWQEHPNSNVTQYQVWRTYKHLGVWYGPDLLTTLNRGTTSYTDYDFIYTNGYTHDLLNYDIRAYYSCEIPTRPILGNSLWSALSRHTDDNTPLFRLPNTPGNSLNPFNQRPKSIFKWWRMRMSH
jgi:hypothetical protein